MVFGVSTILLVMQDFAGPSTVCLEYWKPWIASGKQSEKSLGKNNIGTSEMVFGWVYFKNEEDNCIHQCDSLVKSILLGPPADKTESTTYFLVRYSNSLKTTRNCLPLRDLQSTVHGLPHPIKSHRIPAIDHMKNLIWSHGISSNLVKS